MLRLLSFSGTNKLILFLRDIQKLNYSISPFNTTIRFFLPLLPLLTKAIDYFFNWKSLTSLLQHLRLEPLGIVASQKLVKSNLIPLKIV